MRDGNQALGSAGSWKLSIAHPIAEGGLPGHLPVPPIDRDSRTRQKIKVLNDVAFLDAALAALRDDLAAVGIGLRARDLDPSFHALVARKARRLEECLASAVRLASVQRARVSLKLREGEGGVFLEIETTTGASRIHGSHLEFVTGAIIAALQDAVGRPLKPLGLFFVHHCTIEHADALGQLFGVPVHFGCDRSGILFDPWDLKLPVVETEDPLLACLDRIERDVLSDRTSAASPVTARTERAIVDLLQTGEATQATIAGVLDISARTLARWLDREGRTFGGVLSSLRHRLANRYLQEPALTLAEVTFLLGYADQSSFTTAYKGWCGRSPGQVRSLLGLRS